MSAGKHGSPEFTIAYDGSPGGAPVSIQNGVLTIGGIKIESVLQLTQAYGDSWDESTPTGMRKVAPITMTGFFDDTASTGTHVVLKVTDADVDPNGSTRTLTVAASSQSGSTVSGETRLVSYEVLGKNGNLTDFSAVVQPTGVWAWS